MIHSLFTVLLVLHSATVIAVLENHEVMLALQIGDIIYTAEFSHHALNPGSFTDGEHIAAEIRNGKMRVKRKDGKVVAGHLIWEQRVLVHPIP
jgi:hypothetical protein